MSEEQRRGATTQGAATQGQLHTLLNKIGEFAQSVQMRSFFRSIVAGTPTTKFWACFICNFWHKKCNQTSYKIFQIWTAREMVSISF